MQLQRIVVGVDFRGPSLAAAEWTARVLAPEAELVLAHTLVPAADTAPTAAARADATQRLHELARRLGVARAQVEVGTGDPADHLAELAEEHGAGLVVVGAHGDRPTPWDRFGTTAERLLTRSPVPVVVAAGALHAAPTGLLVPVQADDISEAVFHWARQLEERFDPKVAVVHVEGPPVPTPTMPPGLTDEDGAAEAVAAPAASPPRWRRLIADRAPGRVFTDAVWGDPAESILAEAERFDSGMIVMSDRALGAVRRLVADHAVDQVLRGAARPVLVVVDR